MKMGSCNSIRLDIWQFENPIYIWKEIYKVAKEAVSTIKEGMFRTNPMPNS